jgi:metallo-beta-lactamase superfamily protein
MSPSEARQREAQLGYRVFTATRPGLVPDVPSGYESLMWVANSATLIYGTRDAVLVDTFLTLEQSVELADQIALSGKNLTYIYITHAHGDHFFGIDMLKRRFPGVSAVTTASVVDRIEKRLATHMELLRGRFPGQIPDDPGIPERLDEASIELEGHPLIPIEAGTPTPRTRRACTRHRSASSRPATSPRSDHRHPAGAVRRDDRALPRSRQPRVALGSGERCKGVTCEIGSARR